MWARLLFVSGALVAGCSQLHADLEASTLDGSVDATPREGPDTAAEAAPEAPEAAPEAAALPDASVPPDASAIEVELFAHLRFVEAMRVGSGAVIVAERVEDDGGESRRIRRVDILTGELTVVTSDVQDRVIDMTLAAGRVVWAEYCSRMSTVHWQARTPNYF
jgi:hypothetical protein